MPKLHIEVECEQYEFEHTLHSAGPKVDTSASALYFTSDTALHIGHSDVYRGKLRKEGEDETQEVVCKIVRRDGILCLKAEAELYEMTLKGYQVRYIPGFLGYFEGISSKTDLPIACMLLQYCGKTLGGGFGDHPIELKVKAINILLSLHTIGILHNDWGTHNIIVDEEGNVRIVNFGEASVHRCPLKRRIQLYEFEPSSDESPCPEVYEAAINMEIFTPSMVGYLGFGVRVSEIKGPDTLVELVMPYFLTRRSKSDLREEAVRVLDAYMKRYGHRFRSSKAKKPAEEVVDQ